MKSKSDALWFMAAVVVPVGPVVALLFAHATLADDPYPLSCFWVDEKCLDPDDIKPGTLLIYNEGKLRLADPEWQKDEQENKPCYPPCGMGSTMTGEPSNPCRCPEALTFEPKPTPTPLMEDPHIPIPVPGPTPEITEFIQLRINNGKIWDFTTDAPPGKYHWMLRETDGPDEQCWNVNCRKADPQCPEAHCTSDIPGSGLMTCPAIYFLPCEQVCDQFCVRGTLKKAENVKP